MFVCPGEAGQLYGVTLGNKLPWAPRKIVSSMPCAPKPLVPHSRAFLFCVPGPMLSRQNPGLQAPNGACFGDQLQNLLGLPALVQTALYTHICEQ